MQRTSKVHLPSPTPIADPPAWMGERNFDAEYFQFGKCFVERTWSEGTGYVLRVARKVRFPSWEEVAHARYTLTPDPLNMGMVFPSEEYILSPSRFFFQVVELMRDDEARHFEQKVNEQPQIAPTRKGIVRRTIESKPDNPLAEEIFRAQNTHFFRYKTCAIQVSWVAGRGWDLYIKARGRYPTWEETAYVRYGLIPDHVEMVMFLPPSERYINVSEDNFILVEIPPLDVMRQLFAASPRKHIPHTLTK